MKKVIAIILFLMGMSSFALTKAQNFALQHQIGGGPASLAQAPIAELPTSSPNGILFQHHGNKTTRSATCYNYSQLGNSYSTGTGRGITTSTQKSINTGFNGSGIYASNLGNSSGIRTTYDVTLSKVPYSNADIVGLTPSFFGLDIGGKESGGGEIPPVPLGEVLLPFLFLECAYALRVVIRRKLIAPNC